MECGVCSMKTGLLKKELLFDPCHPFEFLSDSISLGLTEESITDNCSSSTNADVKIEDDRYVDVAVDDVDEASLSPFDQRRSSTGSNDSAGGGFRNGSRSAPVSGSGLLFNGSDPNLGPEPLSLGSPTTPTKGSARCLSVSRSGHGFGSIGPQSGPNRVRHKAGHTSYADLITRAILSVPEMRMTLSQIYDWMADHVAGLQEQRSLHSSKGWKNAVRHTLSINPRFKRIQRQGRPGLWMVESINLSNRYHTLSNSSSGSSSAGSPIADPASPPTVDAPFLVRTGSNCLETDHFRLTFGSSPTTKDWQPSISFEDEPISPLRSSGRSYPTTPLNIRGRLSSCSSPAFDFNCARQTIAVFHEDGTMGYLTLPNPVHLTSRLRQEGCTQTDDANSRVQIERETKQPGSHSKVHVKATSCESSQPTSLPRNLSSDHHFFSLPDDLQDISLDPSLDCGNEFRDQYWF